MRPQRDNGFDMAERTWLSYLVFTGVVLFTFGAVGTGDVVLTYHFYGDSPIPIALPLAAMFVGLGLSAYGVGRLVGRKAV